MVFPENAIMTRVGIIGLGLLGSALAERLLAAGFPVSGFDVKAEALDNARRCGVRAAASAADVAANSDCVLLSLPDSRSVSEVAEGIADACAGRLFVDTTTGAPEDPPRVGRRLAERGARYVEANVVGSSAVVRAGQAIVLFGGEGHVCDEALALAAAFAARSFYVGPLGSASRAKLVVNLVLGLNRAALAEGLNLARCCGLDLAAMLEILRSGAAYSRVMDAKGKKMTEAEFSPEARLAQHHKDVRLIMDLANQIRAAIPLTLEHDRLLTRAESLGLAELDNSAILRAFAADSGH